MSMCISTAQARTKRVSRYQSPAFSRAHWVLWSVLVPCDLFQRACAEILPRNLHEDLGQETSHRDLANRTLGRRPLIEISYRDLVKRAEILLKDVVQRASTEISLRSLTEIFCANLLQRDLFKSLAKRPLIDILPVHLLWRPCTEKLHGDLLQRSCQDVFYINLAKRAFLESLCRDLMKRSRMRSLIEILPRRSRQETSKRDLCRESSYIELLYTDLARRPLAEILQRDLVKRAEAFLGDHLQIA